MLHAIQDLFEVVLQTGRSTLRLVLVIVLDQFNNLVEINLSFEDGAHIPFPDVKVKEHYEAERDYDDAEAQVANPDLYFHSDNCGIPCALTVGFCSEMLLLLLDKHLNTYFAYVTLLFWAGSI